MTQAVTAQDDIRYVILLSDFEGATKVTPELIKAHVKHLEGLENDGVLELCGPFKDAAGGGMVVIKAKSLKDAERVAKADPFVKSGAKAYDLRVMMRSCAANNHLGFGSR